MIPIWYPAPLFRFSFVTENDESGGGADETTVQMHDSLSIFQ